MNLYSDVHFMDLEFSSFTFLDCLQNHKDWYIMRKEIELFYLLNLISIQERSCFLQLGIRIVVKI